MFRDIPRWVFVAVILLWTTTIATDAASFLLDPEFDALQMSWRHFFLKRGMLALYWIAVTIAALFWYRDRPITADNLGRSVAAALAITVLACLGFALYFGGALSLLSGGRLSWAQGISLLWSVELLYACLTVWQVLFVANAYHYYARMMRKQREGEQLQVRLARAELTMFRAQLEPHFLFNALNSVASLVRLGRNEEAVDSLTQLGALLRGVLEVGQRQLMTWQWESEFTRMYVALQKLRFGERLEVDMQVEDMPGSTPFPILLLQPLIENAIHHGPLLDARACRISVRVRRSGGRIRIDMDNAIGQGTAVRASPGVGLGNIAARLDAIYGTECRFAHSAVDGRFLVHVEFPECPASFGSPPE